jgi:uncharacterized protein (TIGR03382 family)
MKNLLWATALLFAFVGSAHAYEVKSLWYNGQPDLRLDILILGDGYTAEEQDKLEADAQSVVDNFFTIDPFSSLKDRINIHLVPLVSKESGADKVDADYDWNCDWAEVEVDTVLNCGFCCEGVQRLTCCSDSKVLSVADTAFPYWDSIFVIMNSDIHGGGGYDGLAVFTVNSISSGVAHHELGHSLAELDDEYEACYPAFPAQEQMMEAPNITRKKNREEVPWKEYIEEETPVPTVLHMGCEDLGEYCGPNVSGLWGSCSDFQGTPVTQEYQLTYWNKTGLFEGGRYTHYKNFRPTNYCLMRDGFNDFCVVCHDAVAAAILTYAPVGALPSECWGGPGKICLDDHNCTLGICVEGVGCNQLAKAKYCDDDNPCTDDWCSAEVGCVHDPVSGFCDDGNVCTLETCSGGLCKITSYVPSCCTAEADCGDANLRCNLAENRCVSSQCLPCSNAADCFGEGVVCAQFLSGWYCSIPCASNADCFQWESVCDLTLTPNRCVPEKGDCYCSPEDSIGCFEGELIYFDACGYPAETITTCFGRGCVNGTCCGKGTHQEGESCKMDKTDPPPPVKKVEPQADVQSSAESVRIEATESSPTLPARPGCGAGPLPTTSAWPLFLLLLLASSIRLAARLAHRQS